MSGIDVSYADGVQVITIDRPEVRNAIDHATAVAIDQAITDLEAREDIGASIITGSGTAFCAGMDLRAFLSGERPSTPTRGFAGLVERPPTKPLIAAVNGPAIAGGFEIVLACDLAVASETAVFGLPEVKRGLIAAAGGLIRLPRRIPYHVAMEWALLGEYVSAQRAFDLHLINRLVPEGEALAEALKMAKAIVRNGPLAVRGTKQTIIEAAGWPADDAFDRGRLISEPVRASDDAKEGATAFREKRDPVWRGR